MVNFNRGSKMKLAVCRDYWVFALVWQWSMDLARIVGIVSV